MVSKTALDLTPQERLAFRPYEAIARLDRERREENVRRADRAWQTAVEAANLLRETFGANRVVVFGSLADKSAFTAWSDIDLAAWGIPAELYFAAVAAISGLSAEFRIDMVDPEACRPSVRDAIEREGVDL